MIVPSGFTQHMSLRVKVPLSIPPGDIQISPLSSSIERLPPDVVVRPLLYIRDIIDVIWLAGCSRVKFMGDPPFATQLQSLYNCKVQKINSIFAFISEI